MSKSDHIPTTNISVLREAGQNNWDRFWQQYLEPSLCEISLELRRIGMHYVEPEEFLYHLYCAVTEPAGFQATYRDILERSGLDPDFRGNVPAKFCRLLEAEVDGIIGSRARFRTLLRRIIRRSVLATLRQLMGRDVQTHAAFEAELEASSDDDADLWIDRIWIVTILGGTCREFFRRSDAAKTKAPKRFPRLLYYSLVEELNRQAIADREEIDASNVSRYLELAESSFASCLKLQYPSSDEQDIQVALSGQDTGLIAATYRDEYSAWYGMIANNR